MSDKEKNGEEYEPYIWTCPGCNVTYINNNYCYRCDILEETD